MSALAKETAMYEIGRVVLEEPRRGQDSDRDLAAELLGARSPEEWDRVLRRIVGTSAAPVRGFTRSSSGEAVLALLRRAAQQVGGPGGPPPAARAQRFVRLARDTARTAASLPAYAPQVAALTAAADAAPSAMPQLAALLRRAQASALSTRSLTDAEVSSPVAGRVQAEPCLAGFDGREGSSILTSRRRPPHDYSRSRPTSPHRFRLRRQTSQ
jgi:hypothetical protein